eukprot:746783-Hanusia_phi.AAC.2
MRKSYEPCIPVHALRLREGGTGTGRQTWKVGEGGRREAGMWGKYGGSGDCAGREEERNQAGRSEQVSSSLTASSDVSRVFSLPP